MRTHSYASRKSFGQSAKLPAMSLAWIRSNFSRYTQESSASSTMNFAFGGTLGGPVSHQSSWCALDELTDQAGSGSGLCRSLDTQDSRRLHDSLLVRSSKASRHETKPTKIDGPDSSSCADIQCIFELRERREIKLSTVGHAESVVHEVKPRRFTLRNY